MALIFVVIALYFVFRYLLSFIKTPKSSDYYLIISQNVRKTDKNLPNDHFVSLSGGFCGRVVEADGVSWFDLILADWATEREFEWVEMRLNKRVNGVKMRENGLGCCYSRKELLALHCEIFQNVS
jgi:hypothetical protein